MTEQWLSEPISAFGAMFLLSFAAGSVLPFGSEWLYVLLLSQGALAAPLWLTATAGNTLGGWFSWWLGQRGRLWYEQHRSLPRGWLTASALFRRYGVWSLVLSWVPVIGDLLVMMAGASGTPRGLSLLLMALGKGLRYALIIVLWEAAA